MRGAIQISLLSLGLFLILAFQNCSKVDFKRRPGQLVERSHEVNAQGEVLVHSEEGRVIDELENLQPLPPAEIEETEEPSEEEIDEPSEKEYQSGNPSEEEHQSGSPSESESGFVDTGSTENGENSGAGSNLSLCGLNYPGKSIVIGFTTSNYSQDDDLYDDNHKHDEDCDDHHGLLSQHSTSTSVCMSERACTEIAAEVFNVQGPVRGKGICKPGKTNVVFFSDSEIRSLVDKIKSPRSKD